MRLTIDLRKHPNTTPEEGMHKLFNLENCTPFVERAESVRVMTDSITKPLENYLTAFSIMDIDFALIHNGLVFENEKAFEHIAYFTCLKSVNRELAEQRARCRAIINEYNIPLEVVTHIDDYLNHELLQSYDITINTTLLLREKKNTYTPTDLERKNWNVPKEQAFSHADRLTHYEITTLADKLTAYITLNYYVEHGINSADFNESTTGNLSRKAQRYAMEQCGHADRIPPEDEQTLFRTSQLYYRLFD